MSRVINEKTSSMRVQLIEPYIHALRDRADAARILFAKHGINPEDISDPMRRMSITDYIAFTYDAAVIANDTCLGLRLGASRRPESGPIINHMFSFSDSLREAIDVISENVAAFQERTLLAVTKYGKNWAICYRINDVVPEMARQDAEFTLSALCSLIRLRRRNWQPLEIHFEHDMPDGCATTYKAMFLSPVRFNQSINRIVISASDLDEREARYGSTAAELLQQHLRGLSQDMEASALVSYQVALSVSRKLGWARCDLASVAGELNMSSRSLQRHLAIEGKSFNGIVKEQKMRLAASLIRSRSKMTMAAIASMLGYADETSWSRAFKSWTGVSPKRYAKSGGRIQSS